MVFITAAVPQYSTVLMLVNYSVGLSVFGRYSFQILVGASDILTGIRHGFLSPSRQMPG
jgi:hypothetical protein